jgi:hypothetical protein
VCQVEWQDMGLWLTGAQVYDIFGLAAIKLWI